MKRVLTIGKQRVEIDLIDGDTSVVADNSAHPSVYLNDKYIHLTEKYLNLMFDLLKSLPPRMNVVELFGGIGIYPMMMWDILKPKSWTIFDYDPWCKRNFQKCGALFVQENVFSLPMEAFIADMVIMDYPGHLLSKLMREPSRYQLFKRVTDAKPRFLELTDCGPYWVHLPNHKPIYKERFGYNPTKENYEQLLDIYFREEFGYGVKDSRVGAGSGYYIFERI